MGNGSLMLGVAISGLAVLIAIALIIGRLDARARNGAWNRIAAARKQLWLDRQQLEDELLARFETPYRQPHHPHDGDR